MSREIVIGLFMAAPGIFFFAQSLGIASSHDLSWAGPKLFPLLASGLMTIFGVAVAVSGWVKDRKGAATDAVQQEDAAIPQGQSSPLALVTVVLLVFVYAAVLDRVGFVPSTFILLACIAVLAGVRQPLPALLLSALTTGAIWLVFTKAFSIFLPAGSIF